MAKKLGRRSIGIEQEREYFKIGVRRLGLGEELDGEELRPLEKTYVRKNGKVARTTEGERLLFDE